MVLTEEYVVVSNRALFEGVVVTFRIINMMTMCKNILNVLCLKVRLSVSRFSKKSLLKLVLKTILHSL